jgi:hypothetical protein
MTTYNNNASHLQNIRRLYSENSTAKAAFDYFASCERNRRATTVDRLLQGLQARGNGVSYGEVKDFLLELARLGCGKYIIGRRGHPSRIEWSVGLVSLGQAAAGNRLQIEEFVEDNTEQQQVEDSKTVMEQVADMKVSYPLRPNRNVELILPKDLTTREAHRLAEFIKTLPFDDIGAAA